MSQQSSKQKSQIWQAPIHHAYSTLEEEKISWLELFYDLVYVVSIFQLGNYLSHHSGVNGVLIFTGLFAVIWSNWVATTFYSSFFVANDLLHRLLIGAQMYFIVMIAVAIDSATGDGFWLFTLFLVGIRVCLIAMYYRAWSNHPESRIISKIFLIVFSTSSVIWLLSLLLPKPYIFWAWGIFILLEQLVIIAYYLNFRLSTQDGRAPNAILKHRNEHIGERYALLTLIVIGESFFKMVIRLSETGIANITPAMYLTALIGFMGVFSLWWIYFDFIADGKVKPSVYRELVYTYCHFPLMFACTMAGVAANGVISDNLLAPLNSHYLLILSVAIALFLLSTLVLQSSLKERPTYKLYTWRLRVSGIAIVIFTYLVGGYIPLILTLLLFSIALLMQVLMPLVRSKRNSLKMTG